MGMICSNKTKADNDSQKTTTDKTIKRNSSKPLNESMVERNQDAYFDAIEFQYYKEQCNSFDLASLHPDKTTPIKWTTTNQIIGQGSCGMVALGVNEATGELLAVKQVYLKSFNIQQDDLRVQSFEYEIQLLKQLKHENIVTYYGMEKTDDQLNMFMEYVSGGSIQSLLNRYGKFKEPLIQKYIKQILLGLEYLHRHGVIHRDIKGGNVLVDANGNCKLADFGSAKQLGALLEECKTFAGTLYWMAPEVISEKGHGRFADIWSVGCTMIEMATGRPPWVDSPSKDQYTLILMISKTTKPPKFPDSLSDIAKNFLEQCLRVKPKERWNVRKLLQHPWMKFTERKNQSMSNHNHSEELQRIMTRGKLGK